MIKAYLHTDKFTSKHELMKLTGLSERAVRAELSELKYKRPVIYNSSTRGYRLAMEIEDLATLEDVQREYEAVSRCIADIESRKKVFNKQLKCYIAYLKSIEKIFN